jgi:predicted esterase
VAFLFYNMQEKKIHFQFKARYYQIGEINANTKAIWFVLHGYGQLAQYFIKKFQVLTDKQVCVIAPEGLSRFYQEGFYGRVGATWMTKEDRLTDIENYINYLNAVYDEVRKKIQINIPVSVLGFSQGAATATRWVMNKHINFERLILWAGMFPPDMDFEDGGKYLSLKKISLVYGNSDPFLTEERMQEMKMLNEKLNLKPEIISFDGGHDFEQSILQQLV